MSRGRLLATFAVSLAVVIALLAIVIAFSPRAGQPASSTLTQIRSGFPSPSASGSASAASDPCHRAGVTYCALNPDVTPATVRSTICVAGWTATIRPPESYTEALKLQQMASEKLPGSPRDYEEDHRMPLELGGDPRDLMNLSPESHTSSYMKDGAENDARREVCIGGDLRAAQAAFVAAWLGPYPAYAK